MVYCLYHKEKERERHEPMMVNFNDIQLAI